MTNREELLKRLLSTTATLAFIAAAPHAYAQVGGDADSAVPDSAETSPPTDDLDDDIDEVVSTGIRQAIEDARNLKRNADTAVDSITASDVSTLPDLSVAEALARVPGVVVQRIQLSDQSANPDSSGGDFPSPEGGGNLVRGLTLVRSEFNGRDAFSANGGRALDFGTIPPELIGAVDVYKNTSADLIEGGIGGSINLRTLEPFDRPGFTAVVTADATYTDLRDEITPDLSGVISNRWDTAAGEFGLLGSISYSELKSDLNGFQIGQVLPFPVDADGNSVPAGSDPALVDRFVAAPNGFQLRTNEVDRDRESYYLAGQYRSPDGDLELTAKYALIKNEQRGLERTFETFTGGETFDAGGPIVAGRPTQILGPAQIGFNGPISTTPFDANLAVCNGNGDRNPSLQLCDRTFRATSLYQDGVITDSNRDWIGASGANFSNLSIFRRDTAETDDLSLNAKWRPTDQLYVNLDAHRTNAESGLEWIWGGTRFFSDFRINPDLDDPFVEVVPVRDNNPVREAGGGASAGVWAGTGPLSGELSDPGNNFLLFASDEFDDNDGDLFAVRGDVEYEFDNEGWFDSVKFGARFSERDQTNRQTGQNWANIAAPWAGGNGYLPLSQLENDNLYETVDFADFFRGDLVRGEDTNFVFVNPRLLSDYDSFVDALVAEPLITNAQDAQGNLVFDNGGWDPLKVDGVVDFDRAGNLGTGRIVEDIQNYYGRVDLGNEFDNGMSIDVNFGLRVVVANVDFDGGQAFNRINDTLPPTFTDANGNEQPFIDPVTGERLGSPTEGPVDTIEEFLPELVAFTRQGDRVPFVGEAETDTQFLPSVNAKWNLNDNALFRFGFSENVTRPGLGQLSPNQRISASTTRIVPLPDPNADPAEQRFIPPIGFQPNALNIGGGNPNLRPIKSSNYDLSFENYWGEANQFSVALFHKALRNNIVYGSELIGTTVLDNFEIPIFYNGDINQDEADISGVELAYTQFYDELPGLLSNLGLQANYTYIDASVNAPQPVADTDGDGEPDQFVRNFRYGVNRFPGLSEHAFNVIGIYQSDAIEFRLAYNWRSDYLSSYRDFVTGNPIFQDDRGYLDGSIKWDINDNLQLRAQVANILDTQANAFQQISASGETFGRTAFLGDRRIRIGARYQF